MIEFDPHTEGIVWQYAGDAAQPFYSGVRSAQERLVNGNTLITESEGGRLFEVTPAGEIVWEYRNPARGGEDEPMIAVVSWGQRIDPATLDPAFVAGWRAGADLMTDAGYREDLMAPAAAATRRQPGGSAGRWRKPCPRRSCCWRSGS